SLSFWMAFFRVATMASCPIISSKFFGRHFNAKTIYDIFLRNYITGGVFATKSEFFTAKVLR
ncbi:MAG: hypothetical protein Q8N61_02295, partial [bacterium]|nr:hypothetical protein [bacterium]